MYGIPNLAIAGIGIVVLAGLFMIPRLRSDPEASGESAGDSTGHVITAVIGAITSFFGGFARGILKWMPGRGSIGDALVVSGHRVQMRKYDAIVNVIYGDGVVKPRPATWESDRTAFKTNNGEMYSAKGVGYDPKRLHGKVPVVWALRDSHEITEPLEAVIGRARRMGKFMPYEGPDGNPDVAVDIDPNNLPRGEGVAGRQAARADGGDTASMDMSGTIVSFREGYELFGSKVPQEAMQNAEDRGKFAALQLLGGRSEWRVILYVLGGVALGLFGPSIASQIATAGSSAAGGMSGGIGNLPLLLGVLF